MPAVLLNRTAAMQWRNPGPYKALMNRSDKLAPDSNPLAFLLGGGETGSLIPGHAMRRVAGRTSAPRRQLLKGEWQEWVGNDLSQCRSRWP